MLILNLSKNITKIGVWWLGSDMKNKITEKWEIGACTRYEK